MILKRILYSCLNVLICLPVFAQNISKDLLNINETYGKQAAVSLRLRMNLYNDWNSTASVEKTEGQVKKYGENAYVNLGDVESIVQKPQTLVIDHQSKIMVLQSATVSGEKPAAGIDKQLFIPLLDSMLPRMCSDVNTQIIGKELNSCTFTLKSGEYSKITIVYSTKSYVLKKIILFFRGTASERPRIEIEYLETSFPGTIAASEFSFDKYLTRKGKGFELKKAYSTYQLLNR